MVASVQKKSASGLEWAIGANFVHLLPRNGGSVVLEKEENIVPAMEERIKPK